MIWVVDGLVLGKNWVEMGGNSAEFVNKCYNFVHNLFIIFDRAQKVDHNLFIIHFGYFCQFVQNVLDFCPKWIEKIQNRSKKSKIFWKNPK